MNRNEYLNEIRKFEDGDLINNYNLNISDRQIAKEFDCSKTIIRVRRMRLGLKSNYLYNRTTTLSKDKLKESIRRIDIASMISNRKRREKVKDGK